MNSFRRRVLGIAIGTACALGPAAIAASAQINSDIIEQNLAALEKQGAGADTKRPNGTLPQDWAYQLPPGVSTRQVTFYVDGGTPLYGKLFFPRGFAKTGKWPAVVVGHGINAISIGIEKYAARFADRGLVAMAIDYVSYGYSGGEVSLLEPDTTTDDRPVWQKFARIQMKRTDLNNFHEIDDYRAAVSFLQGEPGVDPGRIGIWGTSNAGGVVISVAAQDARVKAVVSQVMGTGAYPATGPVPISPAFVDDAILRARTGQGAEADGGFSFRTKIDFYSSQIDREVRSGSTIDRIPETLPILSILAQHDELIPPAAAPAAAKAFKGTWQVVTLPAMTHFQMYSHTAFEVDSTLAGDWFVKYLGKRR
ncbi:MAG TPA: dienelactone hydrolase family protein [Candidatus Acidoferrales bacterium]|nr:dienelactone hydrolase family protein [Candidatus Acidoferrales bacterium]